MRSLLLLVPSLASLLTAQNPVWNKGTVFEPRSGQTAVYDSARAVVVLFGGFQTARYDETWEWDGVAWALRAPSVRPSARRDAALAYDAARQRVVMFGGNGTTGGLADTWEYDGTTWTQRTPALSPSGRDGAQMAFDSTRGVTILYGGQGTTALGDTWQWNGSTWTQLAPASSPGPRELGGLVDDPVRQRLVLFGGTTGSANQNDTWEWNGSTWTAVPTANAPTVRQRFGLVQDLGRGRTIVFGGSAGATRFNDTWEYDGSDWTPVATANAPVVRDRVAFAYDAQRARSVLCGGRGPTNAINLADTWSFDGSAWTLRADPQQPALRTDLGLASEALGGTLLFGGQGASAVLGDTWQFDGAAWRLRTPTTTPTARRGHAMVLDSTRARIVLFGGLDGSGTALDDTWEWDGSTWLATNPAIRPAARSGHALAFDPQRGRVVLFGGLFGFASLGLNDTWEWDGTTWTAMSPTTPPAARTEHALAFDGVSGAVLLFGGATVPATTPFGDTWRWDGSQWTALAPAATPAARANHALVHDPVRARTLLFGGRDASNALRGDSWEWDGSTWAATATTGPSARADAGVAYDVVRRRHVLFGGALASANSAETWEYAFVDGADAVPFGNGCAGSTGVPMLAASSGPHLGNASFALRLSSLLPNALAVIGLGTTRVYAPLGSCTLHLDGNAALLGGLADASGIATQALAIPNNPGLLGVHLFAQGAGLDANGPLFGFLALSAGLDLRLGQ